MEPQVSYPLKVAATVLALVLTWRSIDWGNRGGTGVAAVSGVLIAVLWVVLEGTYPRLSPAASWDPTDNLGGGLLIGWLAVRILGTAALVPVIEELFWRGFLLRWIQDSRFEAVAHGSLTTGSFAITSILFAVEHERWLPGLMAGMVFNLVYYRTRSLTACVVAHAIANLSLAVFVLSTGRWEFW